MIAMLRNVTPHLMAVLIGIAVFAGTQARHYASMFEDAQAEIVRGEERAEALLEHQLWQRRRIESLSAALNERVEQMQRDSLLMDRVRSAVSRLEEEDAEAADWAGQPVPGAVGSWVRQLTTENGGSAGGDVVDDARASSEPTSGSDSQSDEQPGPVGSAG